MNDTFESDHEFDSDYSWALLKILMDDNFNEGTGWKRIILLMDSQDIIKESNEP